MARAGAAGAASYPSTTASDGVRRSARSAVEELNAPDIARRVLKLALRQLDRLIALESKVLRDESTEPVHDLRVASRRLQGLVDFLCPATAANGIRKLRRRLKKARKVLGGLRNQDVMASRIERAVARKRSAHLAAWKAAQEYVSKLRPRTAERAHRKLTRLNLSDLYVRMRKELEERCPLEPAEPPRVITFPEETAGDPVPLPINGIGAPESGRSELAEQFARRLEELWRDFVAKAAASHEDASGLHALRIAAKKVRYLIEVAADLEVTGSQDTLTWLRELQGRVGDWHDYQVLTSTMLEMVARRDFLERHLPLAIGVEKLVLGLRRSRTRSCRRYLSQTFRSPDYHRAAGWVSQWAASRSAPEV